MATEKTCFKCGQTKPMDEFYKHPYMSDGHLGKCKECAKSDVAKHRAENIEKCREYDRSRGKDPARKLFTKQITSKWRQDYPERTWAHAQVMRALKKGTIMKLPCWVCGEKALAHHPDYSSPLDVVWLCQAHHKQAHALVKQSSPR